MQDRPKTTVLFEVDEEESGLRSESLWADDLGKNRYKLHNIPYLVYAVSAGDIVYAPHSRLYGCPAFERVIVKSGNRTLRAALAPPEEQCPHCQRVLVELGDLGCGYERFERGIIGINVPGDVSLSQVEHILDRSGVLWEMGDPDGRD